MDKNKDKEECKMDNGDYKLPLFSDFAWKRFCKNKEKYEKLKNFEKSYEKYLKENVN
jgi:hypothetical protein